MNFPNQLTRIEAATKAMGFSMASDRTTGALLRTLAASKPEGRLLELGTGTGLSACWLLDGMDAASRLVTVDSNESVLQVAREYLAADPRISIRWEDGGSFLDCCIDERFDLIFADAWPGKFTCLDQCLSLLRTGGIYVVDDLLPQTSWPEGHAARVPKLMADLKARNDLAVVELEWSTGIAIATKLTVS